MSRSLAGVGFWIVLTLICWALPVRSPTGDSAGCGQCADARGDLSRWPSGRWMGCSSGNHRDPRAPGPNSLVRNTGEPRRDCVAGHCIRLVYEFLPGKGAGPFADFIRAMLAAGVFYGLNVWFAVSLLALRTRQPIRTVLLTESRENVLQESRARSPWLAYGPRVHASFGGRRCCSHFRCTQPDCFAATDRDARHVHPNDWCPCRSSRQARSIYRST